MATSQQLRFFATAPKYLSELLSLELKGLGANIISNKIAGVHFEGDLAIAYRACLWSRLANRILLPLSTFEASDPEMLYRGIQTIDWSKHLEIQNHFAVDFSSRDSTITHTQYGAQKVKDAIVDQFRNRFDERPSVQKECPDVMINVYVYKNEATVSIDLAGESLHKRGYRKGQGEAPLKENLAAAILFRAGWDEIAEKGGALVDVMCGVGTLPIEAALIAGNIAPGLYRDYFGFKRWKQHQPHLWNLLLEEAKLNQKKIRSPIVGWDADARVIAQGINNVKQAKLDSFIHLEKRELAKIELSQDLKNHPGLVIANPPYGERLGEVQTLQFLYRNIGETFKKYFIGWRGAVFTGNPELGKNMHLRAHKNYAFYNGAIPCRLLMFEIHSVTSFQNRERDSDTTSVRNEKINQDENLKMFINRFQKNMKHLEKWAKRENIFCYRLYDADLPDYAMAIDRYENYLHVQEYAPPKTIDPLKAEKRLTAVIESLPEITGISSKNIFYKSRIKQTREIQYEKLAQQKKLITVRENQFKFIVNFTDYIDTGLFLDQRYVRQKILELVKGKHFLNLFAYTGTATVYAVSGGASSTTTVDLSSPYLTWAKQNLALNGFSDQHHIYIQADCLEWLKAEKRKYDVIFVAPPVFSRSKKMDDDFDVVRDHENLLLMVKDNLSKNGVIIFATHKKNFQLSTKLFECFSIKDWSNTLPMDFNRSKNAYFCYLLQRRM